MLKTQSQKIEINDMKSIREFTEAAKKVPEQVPVDPGDSNSMVSDSSSVMSTVLDSISSIFSMSSKTPQQIQAEKLAQLAAREKLSQKSGGSIKRTVAKPQQNAPEDNDIEGKIKEYLIF